MNIQAQDAARRMAEEQRQQQGQRPKEKPFAGDPDPKAAQEEDVRLAKSTLYDFLMFTIRGCMIPSPISDNVAYMQFTVPEAPSCC